MTIKTLTWLGLALFLLVILVPFWWIASMSFKTYEQIQFATSIYVPSPFTWENYTGLWTETRFPLWLRNSVHRDVRTGCRPVWPSCRVGWTTRCGKGWVGSTSVRTPS